MPFGVLFSRDSIRGCVRPSVCPSVGRSVGNLFFRRAETKTANDLFCVYKLVLEFLFCYFFCNFFLNFNNYRILKETTNIHSKYKKMVIVVCLSINFFCFLFVFHIYLFLLAPWRCVVNDLYNKENYMFNLTTNFNLIPYQGITK